jgi:hypothetical protein
LTRCIIRSEHRDYVLPRVLPRDGEDVLHYLYSRPMLLFPTAYVATPSMLVPKHLAVSQPWDMALTLREDIEWLARICAKGTSLLYISEALTVIDSRTYEEDRSSGTSQTTYRVSLEWGDRVLAPVSRRLHRNYVITFVARDAVRQGHRLEALRLASTTLKSGAVSKEALLSLLTALLLPSRTYGLSRTSLHAIRAALSRRLRLKPPQRSFGLLGTRRCSRDQE